MVTTRSTTTFNKAVAKRISDPVDRSLCYAGSVTTQLVIEWDYRATSPDSQPTLPIDPYDVFPDFNMSVDVPDLNMSVSSTRTESDNASDYTLVSVDAEGSEGV
jgi:hypothetical protein